MTLFWLFALLLAFLAAFLLARPLVRPLKEEEHSLLSLNAQVFRERLAELERDRAEDRVDAETFAELKTELERNLLLVDGPRAKSAAQQASSRVLFWMLLGLLPLSALGFYVLAQFNPALPAWWQSEKEMAPIIDDLLQGKQAPADADQHSMPDFIRAMQWRLQSHPNDAQGWFYLGASYMQLNMGEQALQAFERAWRLDKRPDVALAYAQAQIFTNNGQLTPSSRQLLQTVLADNPHHEGALILLGMGAYRSGDYATAVASFTQLQDLRGPHTDPNSEANREIAQILADAKDKLAHPEKVAAASGGIEVSVKVDPSLASKVQQGDTIFVFAKALNGPPMPLAVVRRSASELPLKVELNDSQAMMPSMKLSSVQDVVVNARISHSGTVEALPGDLEAIGVPLKQDGKPHQVELLIREQRQ